MISASHNPFYDNGLKFFSAEGTKLPDETEEAIEAKAAKWLAAVRKLDGGENLNAYVMFPIAVNATGETDMMFVVTAPTFAEWGKFWDAYPDSEVAANEEGLVVCPDSVIWESTKIE